MLSGASQDRSVIVDWSTAPRGQVNKESLGQLPKKLAAGPRVLPRTESSRSQLGTKQGGPPHDHWTKLGQLRHTRSQYVFVVIALFSMQSSRRPRRKKDSAVTGQRAPRLLSQSAICCIPTPTHLPRPSRASGRERQRVYPKTSPRVAPLDRRSNPARGTKQGGPPHDHWAKLGQLRGAIGFYYSDFSPVSDEEVINLLEQFSVPGSKRTARSTA